MAVQLDGKIVVVGSTYEAGAASYDFGLARYNSDGSLDSSFGTGGIVTTDYNSSEDWAYSVAVDPTGRIVVVGYTSQGSAVSDDFALARYNSDGSLDTAFGTNGWVTTDFAGSQDGARTSQSSRTARWSWWGAPIRAPEPGRTLP